MCEKHVFFDSLYRKSPYRKPVEAFVRGDFDMLYTCVNILGRFVERGSLRFLARCALPKN